jgi:Kef-type K+ transport system membrane component KefB
VPFLVLVPLLAPQAGTGQDVLASTAAAAAEVARVAAPITTTAQIAAPPETTAYLAAAVAAESIPRQAATLAQQFLPTVARSLGLLGGIILLGRVALRRVFGAVAATGSSDAFVAACLLTVCGTAIATDAAGFGQTLGAFLAGVLLAESSFRPQVRIPPLVQSTCSVANKEVLHMHFIAGIVSAQRNE